MHGDNVILFFTRKDKVFFFFKVINFAMWFFAETQTAHFKISG